MVGYGTPIPDEGRPLRPIDIVQQVRWLGELTDEQIVAAVRAGGSDAHVDDWPDLDEQERRDMQEQCAFMSRSRLRAWREGRERQPTWLEVRALLSGLHEILD